VTLTRPDFQRAWPHLAPAERRPVARNYLRWDLELWCLTCLPGWFPAPWSPVHRALLDAPKLPWNQRRGQRMEAYIAPRGSAKTTLAGKADILHDAIYGFEACILVLSTTNGDAEALVSSMHALLRKRTPDSALLHDVYGPFEVSGPATRWVLRCPTNPTGCEVSAESMRASVRGHQFGVIRPTKVVMDDIVHPQHVNSPTERARDWMFLNDDVLKCGDVGTIFRLLNTTLHPDDAPSRVQREPRWRVKKWQALTGWPTRQDLWDECRRIWSKLEDKDEVEVAPGYYEPQRLVNARAFYEAHRDEMHLGVTDVLWPARRPLFDLMTAFWTDPAAFYRSDLNDPRDPASRFFVPEKFFRCRYDHQHLERLDPKGGVVARWHLSQLEIAIFHDRAKGGSHNDYPATAVVARDPHGYRYVLDVDLTREPTSGQRARIWRLWERWQVAARVVVGADDTAQTEIFAGESWERDRKDRQKAGKIWNLSVQSVIFGEEKDARIKALEPDCLNGWLLFSASLREEVFAMFRDFPSATHDDAPDAIQAACWMLGGSMPMVQSRGRG